MQPKIFRQHQRMPAWMIIAPVLLGLNTAAWSASDLGNHALPSITGPGQRTAEQAHHAHNHPIPTGNRRVTASYSIPDVTMIDQRGRSVPVRGLFETDKPVLVNFIYTTCTAICPMLSATFQQVQRELGGDSTKVQMVSISIDPEQDTPTELAAYAERFDAGPQWQFLTGTLEDSIALQKAFDTYRTDKMNHAPVVLLRGHPTSDWIRYEGFASAGDLASESRAMMN